MRKIIGMLLVGLVVGASAEVEYGYFAPAPSDGVTNVVLNEGDRMIILSSYQSQGSGGAAEFIIELPSGNAAIMSDYRLGLTVSDASSRPGIEEDRTIVGPCTVTLKQPANVGYAAFKIIRPDVTVQAGPMNIISLPEDNNGDVDLLVETSTDLQSWTPVYSGTAGTSNNAAFFRTRLIQN